VFAGMTWSWTCVLYCGRSLSTGHEPRSVNCTGVSLGRGCGVSECIVESYGGLGLQSGVSPATYTYSCES